MVTAPTHIIHKLLLDVNTTSSEVAQQLKGALSDFVENELQSYLDEVLTEITNTEVQSVIKIDRLIIPMTADVAEFKSLLKEEIAKEIKQCITQHSHGDALVKKQTISESTIDAFWQIIEKGTLPWWKASGEGVTFTSNDWEYFSNDTLFKATLQKRMEIPFFRRQLVQQCKSHELLLILSVLPNTVSFFDSYNGIFIKQLKALKGIDKIVFWQFFTDQYSKGILKDFSIIYLEFVLNLKSTIGIQHPLFQLLFTLLGKETFVDEVIIRKVVEGFKPVITSLFSKEEIHILRNEKTEVKIKFVKVLDSIARENNEESKAAKVIEMGNYISKEIQQAQVLENFMLLDKNKKLKKNQEAVEVSSFTNSGRLEDRVDVVSFQENKTTVNNLDSDIENKLPIEYQKSPATKGLESKLKINDLAMPSDKVKNDETASIKSNSKGIDKTLGKEEGAEKGVGKRGLKTPFNRKLDNTTNRKIEEVEQKKTTTHFTETTPNTISKKKENLEGYYKNDEATSKGSSKNVVKKSNDATIKVRYAAYKKQFEAGYKQVDHQIFELPQNEETQQAVLPNAGLILIHPYIKIFFTNCGFYDTKTQTITEKSKAVHALHYIATTNESDWNANLTFEKFLCGIPLNTSIPREVALSNEVKEQADELLQAVLENWKPLSSASTDLLRHEFLQRSGKLDITGNTPRIIIESKTQDILLDKISWNLSIAKLPWIDSLIYTDW